MNWNIPQTSGQALPISLEAGDRLFMVRGLQWHPEYLTLLKLLDGHLVSSNSGIQARLQTYFRVTDKISLEMSRRFMPKEHDAGHFTGRSGLPYGGI